MFARCVLITSAALNLCAGASAQPNGEPESQPEPAPMRALPPVVPLPARTGAVFTPPPLGAKPTAQQVILRALEAAGGKAAFDALSTRVTTATVTITSSTGASFATSMVTTQRAPARMVVITRSEIGGQTRSGTDGRIAWEVGESFPARLLEGTERDAMVRQAMFAAEARPDRFYDKTELDGVERVGMADCWAVRFTARTGESALHWYAQDSGLLLQARTTIEHAGRGRIESTSLFSDYRVVDGVALPFRVDTTFRGLPYTSVTEVERVEHNGPIDEAVLQTPKEIIALLKPPEPAGATSTTGPVDPGQPPSSPASPDAPPK